MRTAFLTLLIAVLTLSCASRQNLPKDVETVADVTEFTAGAVVTADDAERILDAYSIEFTIPNPLFGESSFNSRRIDPSHQSTIVCTATLLDDLSTKADILAQCGKDSLDERSCRRFEETYREENVREGMFRIRITMESGFSRKSLDPDFWAIYVETAGGIMVEPADIVTREISAQSDSVFSNYHRSSFARNLFYRDVVLYFKRVTFFGEDLLGGASPFLVFVMSREKKTVARVAWNIADGPKNTKGK